jgi:hypothetical protein
MEGLTIEGEGKREGAREQRNFLRRARPWSARSGLAQPVKGGNIHLPKTPEGLGP